MVGTVGFNRHPIHNMLIAVYAVCWPTSSHQPSNHLFEASAISMCWVMSENGWQLLEIVNIKIA